MANIVREKEYTHLGDFQSQLDVLEAVNVLNPAQALKQALGMKEKLQAELSIQAEGESAVKYAALPEHRELKIVNTMIGKIAGGMDTEKLLPHIGDEVVAAIVEARSSVEAASQSGKPVAVHLEQEKSR